MKDRLEHLDVVMAHIIVYIYTQLYTCMCRYLPDIYGHYTKKFLLIIFITAISISIVLTFKFYNISLNLLTRTEVVGKHKSLNHRVLQVII